MISAINIFTLLVAAVTTVHASQPYSRIRIGQRSNDDRPSSGARADEVESRRNLRDEDFQL
jgi:hypothetical protein